MGRKGSGDKPGRRASYRESLGYGALSVAGNVVLGLASSVLVARVYGVDVVGGFALAAAPTLAMGYLSSLREQQGMVRELAVLSPGERGVSGIFTAVISFSFLLSVLVAVPVSLGAYLMYTGPIGRPDLFGPAMLLMGCYLLLQNTSWNLEMLLSAFRAGRELFRVRLLQAISYLVFAVAAGLLVERSLWVLTYAIVGSYALAALGSVVYVRGFLSDRIDRDELRGGFRALPRMVAYGAKITPGTIGYGLSNDAATWILGAIAPLSAVGAYSRSWMLVQRLRDVNLRISESLFPTLVERHATGDRSGFDRAAIDTGRLVSILMLLPAAAAGGAAVGVMKVFGPGFEQGADAFAILMLLPALGGIAQSFSHSLNAVNRPLVNSAIDLVGGLTTVGLTFVLATMWGDTGAALAYLIGFAGLTVVTFLVARQHLTARITDLWPLRSMIGLVLAYAVGFAVARVADLYVPWPGGTLLGLVLGSAAYVAALLVIGGIEPRDRARVADLTGSLRAKLQRRS
jgi:O-antigen/teichoic acid export membrane protein